MNKRMVAFKNISFVLLSMAGIIMYGYARADEKPVKTPGAISVKEAYALCDASPIKTPCSLLPITLYGEIRSGGAPNGMMIEDSGAPKQDMAYLISAKKFQFALIEFGNISMEDLLKTYEKNEVIKAGIIEGEVTGMLHQKTGMCTNSGCRDYLVIYAKPSEVRFMRKIRCVDQMREGTTMVLPSNDADCFDYSSFGIKASEALKLATEERLHNKALSKGAANGFSFDFDKKCWEFQFSDDYRSTCEVCAAQQPVCDIKSMKKDRVEYAPGDARGIEASIYRLIDVLKNSRVFPRGGKIGMYNSPAYSKAVSLENSWVFQVFVTKDEKHGGEQEWSCKLLPGSDAYDINCCPLIVPEPDVKCR